MPSYLDKPTTEIKKHLVNITWRKFHVYSWLVAAVVPVVAVRDHHFCPSLSWLFGSVQGCRGWSWPFVAVAAVRSCRGCSWLSRLFLAVVAVRGCSLLSVAVPGCRGVASRGNLWLFVAVVVDRWCSWLFVAVCVCSWLALRIKSWRAMLRSTWRGVTEKASQPALASQPASQLQ